MYVDTKNLKKGDLIDLDLISRASSFEDGIVFGRLELTYDGAGGFAIASNAYDFDYGAPSGHPWGTQWLRNSLTVIDRDLSGWNGHDFLVIFDGIVKPWPKPVDKLQAPPPGSYTEPYNPF